MTKKSVSTDKNQILKILGEVTTMNCKTFILFDPVTGEQKEYTVKQFRELYGKYPQVWNEYSFLRKVNCYLIPKNKATNKLLRELRNNYRIEDENWKPVNIEGLEDYQVSNYGRVMSIKGFIMTPAFVKHSRKGVVYRLLNRKECRYKEYKGSKLVGETFKIKGEGDSITHKDMNLWNNAASNLARANRGDIARRYHNSVLRYVAKIDAETERVVKVYESTRQASEDMFCDPSCIRKALAGQQKTSGGYKWRESNENEYYQYYA